MIWLRNPHLGNPFFQNILHALLFNLMETFYNIAAKIILF